MPASKAKKLSSLFRYAIRGTTKTTGNAHSSSPSPPPPSTGDVILKRLVSSIDISSSSTTCLINLRRGSHRSKNYAAPKPLGDISLDSFKLDTSLRSDDSAKKLANDISSLLSDGTSFKKASSLDNTLENVQAGVSQNISLRQKKISRDRKQKWTFKNTQTRRFDRLVKMCAEKLGTDATINVFINLGRETGVKEYNALIKLCIENSTTSEDEVTLEQIYRAYQLFNLMREQGLQIEEETYGPFLTFLINMEMVAEFKLFCDVIRHENPNSLSRLAYYEMLLLVRLNDEDSIKELCDNVATSDDADKSNIRENYLLALCEGDRRKELLQLLDIIDITKISSVYHLATIFSSVGRLSLESLAKKSILALKNCDIDAENISRLIYEYAISLPNLAVQDAILNFKNLHEELEVTPASASYEKVVKHCCTLLKVHAALDIIDHMFETGLSLSLETFHLILQACDESCEFNLVHRIYSLILRSNLKPNSEIFRIMIFLSVRMRDFEGAYNLIKDLENMSVTPTAGMYNAIMAAQFREKNVHAALMVLKEMERAHVKPDSQTFSCLIENCEREDIIKYYEEVKQSGIQITKHVYMALINAYASCGQLKKAKQVILEKEIPVKNLNEVKSVLVSALASHGHMSDALSIYEEIKQSECTVEPKAVLCLIDYLQSEVNLSRLLNLLEDLDDTDYWIDGCCKIILYCVQYKDLRTTIDLLKQLKAKFCSDDIATEVLLDEVFCKIAEMEPGDLQFGLDLLQSIKEELGVYPSRKSLDFLLSACVRAKDSKTSLLVWKEYKTTNLPYNGLAYLRMYQALLACGDFESAKKMQKKIPLDDPHVRCVMKACLQTYSEPTSSKKTTEELTSC